MHAILIIGHALAQLHSGGFGMSGQRGQKHLGGCSFCVATAIGPTLHGLQWQVGFGHAGQRQVIPFLPLVLALGVIAQPQLH